MLGRIYGDDLTSPYLRRFFGKCIEIKLLPRRHQLQQPNLRPTLTWKARESWHILVARYPWQGTLWMISVEPFPKDSKCEHWSSQPLKTMNEYDSTLEWTHVPYIWICTFAKTWNAQFCMHCTAQILAIFPNACRQCWLTLVYACSWFHKCPSRKIEESNDEALAGDSKHFFGSQMGRPDLKNYDLLPLTMPMLLRSGTAWNDLFVRSCYGRRQMLDGI